MESNSARNQGQHNGHKLEVFNEVLRRLRESRVEESFSPSFEDKLWAHFNHLPARYAIDVNVERAEDVLMHKKLLEQARDPDKRPAFSVRVVQVVDAICDVVSASPTKASTTIVLQVLILLRRRKELDDVVESINEKFITSHGFEGHLTSLNKSVNSLNMKDAVELLKYPIVLGKHLNDGQHVVFLIKKIVQDRVMQELPS